ncbi:MAG: hypothetical protein HC869_02430 [Rhodospirillales bacterium]|nr:hypothetical protein [Rhodospirillales bacterium]
MPRRIYIYRSGTTDTCALTADKSDPPLPRGSGDSWRLWMQIGPLQAQGHRYGFDIRAAVDAITVNRYYLFTGSAALLRASERTIQTSPDKGQCNA